MVNSVTPGVGAFSNISTLARDTVGGRAAASEESRQSSVFDQVSLSNDASAADSADRGLLLQSRAGLDLAVAAARQSLSLLGEIGDLAGRAAQPNAPEEARAIQDQSFRGLLSRLTEVVTYALESGARGLAGESVRVGADGATIAGLDLRVGQQGGAISLTTRSSIATAADAAAALADARDSFARVSEGLARLESASANFDVHLGALSALDKSLAARVETSLDEDSARLMALQVRQTLASLDQPIANAGGGVLAHFRS